MTSLPESATYVVIGAGIHGLSTAYHLAELLEGQGRSGSEVVVLDKKRVGAGASGICCGVVRNFYLSEGMNEIMRRSVAIFEVDPAGFGYHPVGYIAAVPDQQAGDLERIYQQQRHIGYRSELVLGEAPAWQHMELIFPDWAGKGVTAVLHERQGGWADPIATLENLAGMARSLGVRIVEGVEVQGFDVHDGVVSAVQTSQGAIACDLVVLGLGPWIGDAWKMLGLPAELELVRNGETVRKPMFSYWKLREGDFFLPDGKHLPDDAPVVHLDLHDPLLSDADGSVLVPGAWGIYFKPGRQGGVQGGGVPVELGSEIELEPYGPIHPEYGSAGDGFDAEFTSGLAAALGRFQGRSADWRCDSHGGVGAFTPDNYPIVDWVLPNVYGILDSNHGFKMLALGQQVASDIVKSEAPALAPFRMKRFEQAALHPVSNSPYPWN